VWRSSGASSVLSFAGGCGAVPARRTTLDLRMDKCFSIPDLCGRRPVAASQADSHKLAPGAVRVRLETRRVRIMGPGLVNVGKVGLRARTRFQGVSVPMPPPRRSRSRWSSRRRAIREPRWRRPVEGGAAPRAREGSGGKARWFVYVPRPVVRPRCRVAPDVTLLRGRSAELEDGDTFSTVSLVIEGTLTSVTSSAMRRAPLWPL
jgi:hypothetical protein